MTSETEKNIADKTEVDGPPPESEDVSNAHGSETEPEAKAVDEIMMDSSLGEVTPPPPTEETQKNPEATQAKAEATKRDEKDRQLLRRDTDIADNCSGVAGKDKSVQDANAESAKAATEEQPSPPAVEDDEESSDSSDAYSNYSGISSGPAPHSSNSKIRLGICAMDKKARSKPMAEILNRLDESQFDIVSFGDDLLLNAPIEEWPIVDALIAFHSTGYPLAKAEAYASMHKPFLLNDLRLQRDLMDRRKVYEKCVEAGIDVPRHVFMSRDGHVKSHLYHKRTSARRMSNGSAPSSIKGEEDCPTDGEEEYTKDVDTFIEQDDSIEVNGVVIRKPFVEKPVDADDHNIRIYYPSSAGGGCKMLFRKVGDRSSAFNPDIRNVRTDGSYIYEEFVETQGTDVKMYTVGPDYGHAEARKSPAMDGIVIRDENGKEVRYPVILSLREKEIARRIVLIFKQMVCGFDLLRVQEGDSLVSYVCDVNGWSFVKNSRKYYEDCAQILTEHMLAAVKPRSLKAGFSAINPLLTQFESSHQCHSRHRQTQQALSNRSDYARKHVPFNKESALQRAGRMLQNLASPKKDIAPKPPQTIVVSGQPEPGAFTTSDSDGTGVSSSPTRERQDSERSANLAVRGSLEPDAPHVRDFESRLSAEPATMEDRSVTSQSTMGLTDTTAPDGTASSNPTNPPPFEGQSSNGPRGAYTMSRQSSNAGSSAYLANEEPSDEQELRCVIAIVRHGDRTPKQKLKVVTSEAKVLQYFVDHCDGKVTKELKVKDRKPMVEFLQCLKTMIAEKETAAAAGKKAKAAAALQSKKAGALKQAAPGAGEGDGKKAKGGEMSLYNLYHMRDVLERWKIEGLNRKLQIKPKKWKEDVNEETGEVTKSAKSVQLILKWGGNLTKLGERQSQTLGEKFRHDMYPDTPGGGILRLHSTFRHDLKIKTSDEGRVMKTAAAFAKGLLELEGEIAPILVALVHKEKDSMHMLDPSGNEEVKKVLDECKERIKLDLQTDFDVETATVEEREKAVGPSVLTSIHESLKSVKNPRKCLFEIRAVMRSLLDEFEDMLDVFTSEDEGRRIEGGEGLQSEQEGDDALSGVKLYKGETLVELTERWRNLYEKLYDEEKDEFDLSRIPDVHDNVRFDMLHNPHLGITPKLQKLYKSAADMAGCVVPQEYGVSIQEKRDIGDKMCRALLEKIKYDLIIARTDNQVDMRYMINMDYSSDLPINTLGRRVRTRLYFTSESHLHTVANVLRFAAEDGTNSSLLSKYGKDVIASSQELCYLTQIIFRLFEDRNRDINDPKRFRVEILFSPGATATPHHMSELERENDTSRFDTQELEVVSKESLTCDSVEKFFMESIKAGFTAEEDDLASTSSAVSTIKKVNKESKEKDKKKDKDTQKDKDTKAKKEVVATTEKGETPMTKSDEKEASATGPPEVKPKVVFAEKTKNPVVANESKSNETTAKRVEVIPEEREVVEFAERCTGTVDEEDSEPREDDRVRLMAKLIARRYLWRGIAAGSLVLGLGCIFIARRLQNDMAARRRWSRPSKRYGG